MVPRLARIAHRFHPVVLGTLVLGTVLGGLVFCSLVLSGHLVLSGNAGLNQLARQSSPSVNAPALSSASRTAAHQTQATSAAIRPPESTAALPEWLLEIVPQNFAAPEFASQFVQWPTAELADLPAQADDAAADSAARPALRASYTLPGEFEPQAALLLGCGELIERHPQLFADIVSAVHRRIQVLALIPDFRLQQRVQQTLRSANLPATSVHLVEVPFDTMWIRDYGPQGVRSSTGRQALVDPDYLGPQRQRDNEVPQHLAARLGWPVHRVGLQVEGGNLLSNGQGLLLTTTNTLERNAERGADENSVQRLLATHWGATQTLFLEPLLGEPTGHVDMFCAWSDARTVVVGEYPPGFDPENALLLDRNAARLQGLRTAAGPLRVIRMPMPPHWDGHWRTYTNVLFCNGVLLVPTYDVSQSSSPADAQRVESQALDLWRSLLPGWQVRGIPAEDVIALGGALHCLALNIPARPLVMEAASDAR